jgi:transcriptional regulator with XRE-family HTH domain
MFTGAQAKRHLKQNHWSYRNVAPVLGVTFQHLSMVLNGHRESRRLLNRIAELPDRLDANPLKGPQSTPAEKSAQEVSVRAAKPTQPKPQEVP